MPAFSLQCQRAREAAAEALGAWTCLLPEEKGAILQKLAWHLHTITEGARQDLGLSPLSRLLVPKIFCSFSPHLMHPSRILASSNSPIPILHSLSDYGHCPLLPELSLLDTRLWWVPLSFTSQGELTTPQPCTVCNLTGFLKLASICWCRHHCTIGFLNVCGIPGTAHAYIFFNCWMDP